MPVWPSDYNERVLKDIEKHKNIRRIVKANIIERLAIKSVSPDHLHPNPMDEFSMENIGPNMEIVSKYVEEVRFNQDLDLEIFKEPLIVQKMEPEGYMLLNGHHRWFAAVRMHVKKIHISIVNLINELDLGRMLDGTENTKLATFDFDEVLLSTDESDQDAIVNSSVNSKFKERLCAGAKDVITMFNKNGYDICVYSSSYLSEEDFNEFFSMYDIKVNVIVNGVNEKRNNTQNMRNVLKDKYSQIVHVDKESVIYSYHVTKDYDICDIDTLKESWADGVKRIVSDKENEHK